MKNNGN